MATNNSDAVISEEENETAKCVYTSIGDTPGKLNRRRMLVMSKNGVSDYI